MTAEREAIEKITDKIEAASYHRNYRQACIDIVAIINALAARPAPEPLDEDARLRVALNVIAERGWTIQTEALAALAALHVNDGEGGLCHFCREAALDAALGKSQP